MLRMQRSLNETEIYILLINVRIFCIVAEAKAAPTQITEQRRLRKGMKR